jgi:predicted NAD/FAD-binding protein
MNIAIIGSGIAGLTCAWRLAGHHQVTLFEAGATPGGHTATVDVSTPQGTYAIDTGFIVYNDRTYPRFMGLLSELGISGQKTQMSFSVHNPATGLEYNGHTLTSLFAQRRNLVNPAFWRLLGRSSASIVWQNRRWTGRWTRTPRCKRFWNSTASRRFLRATTFCRWGPPSGPRRCRR